jgi:hypothetical protein
MKLTKDQQKQMTNGAHGVDPDDQYGFGIGYRQALQDEKERAKELVEALQEVKACFDAGLTDGTPIRALGAPIHLTVDKALAKYLGEE